MGKAAAVRLKLAKVGDQGAGSANPARERPAKQRSETGDEKPEPHA
jgi:hypothetical protein